MTRRPPVPMPHSPGCPGRSHRRHRTPPCPAYAAETAARRRLQPWSRREADCDCCTGTVVPVMAHGDWLLCKRCYDRWKSRAFAPPGPGPGRAWAADSAAEHHRVLLGRTTSQASAVLGVSGRTVTRWRLALRAMVEPVPQP
jgi:hypothetical protein